MGLLCFCCENREVTVVFVFGDIGSGKSAFCAELGKRGALVISSDALVADLYRNDAEMVSLIETAVGQTLRNSDGDVNKQRIADVIFSSAEIRTAVEAIVHPRVQAAFKTRLESVTTPVVVYEVSALKTASDLSAVDVLVEVVAPDDVRLARLVARGMTRAAAIARMKSQAEDITRNRRRDVVVQNSGSLAELSVEAQRLYELWSHSHD